MFSMSSTQEYNMEKDDRLARVSLYTKVTFWFPPTRSGYNHNSGEHIERCTAAW